MSRNQKFEERLQELLAGLALGDLDDQEMETVRKHWSPELAEKAHQLEITAAAVQLSLDSKAGPETGDQIPDALVEKIRSAAPQYLGPVQQATNTQPVNGSTSKMGTREMCAWLVTAAALLLLAGMWFGRGEQVADNDLATLRNELVQQDAQVLQIAWEPGKTPFEAEVGGDVVWSTRHQQGYLRFVGMPVNDPTIEQYQLWIIDPARDDEPVDGGVFDISRNGEVIIPIDAKLAVLKPAAFAITVEKPGGVVVSTQENLPLLAKVAG